MENNELKDAIDQAQRESEGKEVEVAKLTRWQTSGGFYRSSNDPENAIRAFKSLRVLALDDEPPTIEPLNDKQRASAADMKRELAARGQIEDFVEPTVSINFKRALIISKGQGLPRLHIYPQGLSLYVANGEVEAFTVRNIPAVVVNAAFDEEGEGVPKETVMLDNKQLLFTVLLAAAVMMQMSNDPNSSQRTGPKGSRFEDVPVMGDFDTPTEAYVKVQCFIIEGNIAMLDGLPNGDTEMRVYGKVPIFIQPGSTYSVQDLTDDERSEFKDMSQGNFDFTKGVIFDGSSAMIEQLDPDDDEKGGFAFGALRGLCTEGTTITRHVAWLPKDVVEAGGWKFDDELPAPLPDDVKALGEALETATL